MIRERNQMNTAWRWFPVGLFVTMALVFAVNGYLVWTAVDTFPGVAGMDGFDLSNGYDRVLRAEQAQAALGWQVDAAVDAGRHPVLRVTDRAGAPLPGAAIDAQAERPLGPPNTTALSFHDLGNGRLMADMTLFSGQWDVMLTVRANGKVFSTTRRLVVR